VSIRIPTVVTRLRHALSRDAHPLAAITIDPPIPHKVPVTQRFLIDAGVSAGTGLNRQHR
jgi:hypothetical protein